MHPFPEVTGGYAPPKQRDGRHRAHEIGDTDEVKGIPEIDDEEISQDESYAPRL